MTDHTRPSDVRAELGEFLRSRRARLTPVDVGLPVYAGGRRVPGLRREEVALLAGMSVEYYTRIERGSFSVISASVLEGICHALRLDEAEKGHLHDLAGAPVRHTTQRRRPASSGSAQPCSRSWTPSATARPSSTTDASMYSPPTRSDEP